MRPSEVRQRVLADHAALRRLLDHLEQSAARVAQDEPSAVSSLRAEGERLLATLREHMGWEDRFLAPALRRADAWGEERARQLDGDHREQRELLKHVLAGLRDASRPAAVLARNLLDLVTLLRADMEHEERTLLDPRVLRDDVISLGEPE